MASITAGRQAPPLTRPSFALFTNNSGPGLKCQQRIRVSLAASPSLPDAAMPGLLSSLLFNFAELHTIVAMKSLVLILLFLVPSLSLSAADSEEGFTTISTAKLRRWKTSIDHTDTWNEDRLRHARQTAHVFYVGDTIRSRTSN